MNGPFKIITKVHKPPRHLTSEASPLVTSSVSFSFTGMPLGHASAVMVDRVEIDFAASRGYAEVPATKDTLFYIRKMDDEGRLTTLGTAKFIATLPMHLTFSGYTTTVLESGEVLQVWAPETPDVTLRDVSITIRAVRL